MFSTAWQSEIPVLTVIGQRLEELVPTPSEAALGGVAGLAVFAAAGLLAAGGRRRGLRVEDTRKLFHFLIFTAAAGLRAATEIGSVMTFGAVVFLGVLDAVRRGPDSPLFEALARSTDAPRRALYVVVPLLATALGGVTAHVIGGPAAVAAYLVSGWGDAVGEPVGSRWGRHWYRVPALGGIVSERSWEGTAAVFAASWAAASLGLVYCGLPPGGAIATGLIVAAVSAAVEAVSPHGLDNFTVMVAAALTANLLLSSAG